MVASEGDHGVKNGTCGRGWVIRQKSAQKLVQDVRQTGNEELLGRLEDFVRLVDEQRQVERAETKNAILDLEARIERILKQGIEALPTSLVETDMQLTEHVKLFP